MSGAGFSVSVVISTLNRHEVLIQTVRQLIELEQPPCEIIVVDQTKGDWKTVQAKLLALDNRVRYLRQNRLNVARRSLREPALSCPWARPNTMAPWALCDGPLVPLVALATLRGMHKMLMKLVASLRTKFVRRRVSRFGQSR